MLADVYGSLATRAGYTPAQIDEMFLEDAQLLHDYWGREPPLRDLVAGFMGVKPRMREETASQGYEVPGEFEDGADG